MSSGTIPEPPIKAVITRTASRDSDTSSISRRVSFAAEAQVRERRGIKSDSVPVKPFDGGTPRSYTPETFSDASSATGSESGFYEIIEYDPSKQIMSFNLNRPGRQQQPPKSGAVDPVSSQPSTADNVWEGVENEEEFVEAEAPFQIEDNTPAAEALRASASVRVSRVGKAARAVHIQAVRRLVKRATLTGKQGVVKGKPPRLPPRQRLDGEADELSDLEEEDETHEEDIHEFEVSQMTIQDMSSTHYDGEPVVPDDVVQGTAEAGKKLLGAVDPHDMLKLLRWRKKKKGSLREKPKSYVKGKVIDGEHELYTLSIAVMIGVRTSIAKTNHILNIGPHKRWVIPQDFKTTEKYEFRPTGGTGMPSHQLAHTFKFKDYSPVAFAYLRRMAGINEFDFLISVCGNANFIEFISNAKSGQFFFYSSDGRYMIKTMTNAESKFLRRILPDYYKHCCENPNTMITRFFGMYRVKLYHLRRNVKFVIMNSVYDTDKILHSFYDLKGSSLGRDAKPHHTVKKDNDLRKNLPADAFVLPSEQRERVRGQLKKDLDFLEANSIMDYSMLVGVHHVPAEEDGSVAPLEPIRRRKTSHDYEIDTAETHLSSRSHRRQRSGSNMSATLMAHNRRASDDFYMGIYDALDDDDSSYLAGSSKRPPSSPLDPETEKKKKATIEKLYWPFHHLFDIHGYRKLKPAPCAACTPGEPCRCRKHEVLAGYKIADFEEPLSDRKDGGFEMDTTHRTLPMVFKGPHGDQQYEGKIFYMGVIDILQEYTGRKILESQYRLATASNKNEPSCVKPSSYAKRFLRFFDEYTSDGREDSEGLEMTLDIHRKNSLRKT